MFAVQFHSFNKSNHCDLGGHVSVSGLIFVCINKPKKTNQITWPLTVPWSGFGKRTAVKSLTSDSGFQFYLDPGDAHLITWCIIAAFFPWRSGKSVFIALDNCPHPQFVRNMDAQTQRLFRDREEKVNEVVQKQPFITQTHCLMTCCHCFYLLTCIYVPLHSSLN